MGLDASTRVIIGVPIELVVKEQIKITPITKYNEDTGEPYIKQLEEVTFVVGDKEFSKDDWNLCMLDHVEYPEECPLPGPLNIHYDSTDEEEHLVGKCLFDTGSHRCGCKNDLKHAFHPTSLQDQVEIVKALFYNAGFEEAAKNVLVWVQLHLSF